MGRAMGRFVPATVMLAVLGCGSPGTAPTAPATGTVTYKGKPVEGVSVGFIPEKGRPASGLSDASGKFTVSTFKRGDGAVPGKHKVIVAEAASSDPGPMPGMPGYKEPPAKKARFPARYSDVKTTSFSVEVTTGKKNEFTLDMTD